MSLLSPQLQAFAAIVANKTVHNAAKNLHITQTAVTQRIRTLENNLQTTLFIRTRRGMQLTHEGEALLRYCNAATELEGETLAHFGDKKAHGVMRISLTAPSTLMNTRILPQTLVVRRRYPNLLFSFQLNDEESRINLLREGKVQFALVSPSSVSREMASKTLAPEKFLLVCTKKWHHRNLEAILTEERMIDFNESDLATRAYLEASNLGHLARAERHFINNSDAIADLIEQGLGYGVLTVENSQRYLEKGTLIILNDQKIYENPLSLAWYPRTQPPQYFADIIASIE